MIEEMKNKGKDGVNVTSGIAMPDGKPMMPVQRRKKQDEILKDVIIRMAEIVKADKGKNNG